MCTVISFLQSVAPRKQASALYSMAVDTVENLFGVAFVTFILSQEVLADSLRRLHGYSRYTLVGY
jgi:hypothetical protein